jgi:hypothetical protein
VDARPRLFPRRGAERPGLLGRLRTRPRAETPLPAAPAPPPAAQPAPVLAPQPTPVPVPPAIDTDHATAVLTNVLNQLGAARHRPFGAT